MQTLFDTDRSSLADALALTAESLCAYGERYRHWVVAFSGGKDSSATVAAVTHLIEAGRVPRPASLAVVYADTRMELPPLHASAMQMLAALRSRGYGARVVLPELDHRFYVYMFGRGVPPPSNTFRWCTEQIKVDPIDMELWRVREALGEKPLLLIGLRVGESAARDRRMSLACGPNGGECGQGWFQARPPADAADTLALLLHWRTCHVWDWLTLHTREHRLDTRLVAETYDQDGEGSAVEVAARTGCVGCNLASRDFSLQRILRRPEWAYLEPLRRLKPLYAELKKPERRLRKDGTETRADGSLVANPNRLGPLTMDARRWGLAQVLAIRDEVNAAAEAGDRPTVTLIDAEEHSRILELIEANTWPNRWSGAEPTGDMPYTEVLRDGSVQLPLFGD